MYLFISRIICFLYFILTCRRISHPIQIGSLNTTDQHIFHFSIQLAAVDATEMEDHVVVYLSLPVYTIIIYFDLKKLRSRMGYWRF